MVHVHAELVVYRKEKNVEKQKMQEIQDSIKSTSNTQTLEELKKMDLDSGTIQKVQN